VAIAVQPGCLPWEEADDDDPSGLAHWKAVVDGPVAASVPGIAAASGFAWERGAFEDGFVGCGVPLRPDDVVGADDEDGASAVDTAPGGGHQGDWPWHGGSDDSGHGGVALTAAAAAAAPCRSDAHPPRTRMDPQRKSLRAMGRSLFALEADGSRERQSLGPRRWSAFEGSEGEWMEWMGWRGIGVKG